MSRGPSETILLAVGRREERERLAGALRQAGCGVRVAAGVEEALEAFERHPPAVVVTERELPGPGGGRLPARILSSHPDCVVVVLCAEAGVEETVALMREGVFHVLQTPVAPEKLAVVVAKALEHERLSRGNRKLRSQLDISEKLAMIGRLASGVAHELNNPLDGVRRYVRLTQEGLENEAKDLSAYLDHAMSGLGRMAGIVRQLLTFSRNVVLENESEGLRTMLEEVVRTLAPTGSAGAVVELHCPYVDIAVPRVLFQVFANLVRNALDAVEELGPRGRVVLRVTREEDVIEILVEDNGVGIAQEDLRRVFEPFFTTKEVGRGTGLGLPISARIVERCGGTLRIESDPGQGAITYVTLPASARAGAPPLILQETTQP